MIPILEDLTHKKGAKKRSFGPTQREVVATIPSRALGSTVMIEPWNVEELMSLFGLKKDRWFWVVRGGKVRFQDIF